MFIARHRSKDIVYVQAAEIGILLPLKRDEKGCWSVAAPPMQELDHDYFGQRIDDKVAKALLRDVKDVSAAIMNWLDMDEKLLEQSSVSDIRSKLDKILSEKIGRNWKIVVDAKKVKDPASTKRNRKNSLLDLPIMNATVRRPVMEEEIIYDHRVYASN